MISLHVGHIWMEHTKLMSVLVELDELPPVMPPPENLLFTISFIMVMAAPFTASCLFPWAPELSNNFKASAIAFPMSCD